MEYEKQCHFCQSVDFLLFECKGCLFNHCQTHRFEHNCDSPISVSTPVENQKVTIDQCLFEDCTINVNLIFSICPDCHQKFCLVHRHKHSCSNVIKVAEGPKPEPKKAFKSKNLKVELMRLKLNAKGNKEIPSTNRFYYKLLVVSAINNPNELLLFSDSKMIVGKLVDNLVKELDLARGELKFRLKRGFKMNS